jgi:hypothetical protein
MNQKPGLFRQAGLFCFPGLYSTFLEGVGVGVEVEVEFGVEVGVIRLLSPESRRLISPLPVFNISF